MQKPKRIFVLADFKLDSPRNTQIIARKLCKGLIRNGHDVLPFSYRDAMIQRSPISSKRIALKLMKRRTDQFCCQLLRDYQPELVIVLTFRNLDENTIALLRQAVPQARFLGWYEDPLDGVNKSTLNICRNLDWFIATGCGRHLADITKKCGIRGAFMPNPCDPDIERRYDVPDSYRCDIIFTGKLGHKKCGTDETRADLIQTLVQQYGMVIHGALDRPRINGLEYLRRISGAKVGLSINSSNDIRMYHSDRLINYLACGTFVLAKAVPDSNILFEDHKHICYFTTAEECVELLEYYLKQDVERGEIARRGMERAHTEFNCEKIARHVLDLIEKGCYDAPWAEIL